ncbi:uncharacterized protein LY79DRAFT_578190 [Colletotrichum navitas]|uniref:Uncharacterized protein n=1 Tax=Colletotrichum navitas TaxID=681940 RepID=A0AAD8Q2X8_9PEZI|nr:uncharacterized protein LY79DRAFT_578190 [Colletotrichum navitas]KAK1594967.1 hypothetical protein LY79DRAFT_578190 [Colletotrichum navitas]
MHHHHHPAGPVSQGEAPDADLVCNADADSQTGRALSMEWRRLGRVCDRLWIVQGRGRSRLTIGRPPRLCSGARENEGRGGDGPPVLQRGSAALSPIGPDLTDQTGLRGFCGFPGSVYSSKRFVTTNMVECLIAKSDASRDEEVAVWGFRAKTS